jgi:hypothetical protein
MKIPPFTGPKRSTGPQYRTGIWLVSEDAKEVQLNRGDIVVQNGTHHACDQANGFLDVRHPSSGTPTGIMPEGINTKSLMR